MPALPSGAIIEWFGSIASIPAGFTLCDGTAGTPDLRNRFVVGAGDTYAVDDVGGSVDHSHTVTTDPHDHTLLAGSDIPFGADVSITTDTDAPPGTTNTVDNLPPFHALAYIMKT